MPPPLPTPPSHSTSGGPTLLRKEAQKDRREFPPSLTFKSTANVVAEEKPQSTHVRTLTSDLAELETLVAEASSAAATLAPHTVRKQFSK